MYARRGGGENVREFLTRLGEEFSGCVLACIS